MLFWRCYWTVYEQSRQTMKAVVISEPGEAEVLQLQEVDDPIINEDEVLIKVEATALNRADTLQRKGFYPAPKGSSPYLGLECSGIIQALGKNVSRWKVGDQVIFRFFGRFFFSFLKNIEMVISIDRERKRWSNFSVE